MARADGLVYDELGLACSHIRLGSAHLVNDDLRGSQVGDAWSTLVVLPPVAKLLSTAQPSIDFALSKYLEAHDSLVAAPSYNK